MNKRHRLVVLHSAPEPFSFAHDRIVAVGPKMRLVGACRKNAITV